MQSVRHMGNGRLLKVGGQQAVARSAYTQILEISLQADSSGGRDPREVGAPPACLFELEKRHLAVRDTLTLDLYISEVLTGEQTVMPRAVMDGDQNDRPELDCHRVENLQF
ncbi:hypothetical protein RRG08_014681 [Elysia crispata]|uniref:Uncharacterized protein n=1 Tax=Elysia crispata TaxID=231223 RepID=A0AAE1CZ06_9GAST|nr:hypothetical protein RRG08_014681 [Elysia crispata]